MLEDFAEFLRQQCLFWIGCCQEKWTFIISVIDLILSIMRKDKDQFSSVQSLSHVRLFVTPWTAACQASLSIINLILSRKQSLIVQSLAQFFSLALLPLLTFQTFVWYSPLLLSGACILLDAISNSAPCILISNHSVIYTGKPSPFLSIYVKYQCRNDV